MRKFLLTILVFVLVFGAIVTASLFFVPNEKIADNSLFANIDKHKRLDSLLSPKIIFVGGSNLAFGLDSKMIEGQTGLPVVNMGLHAGFGLQFPITEAKHAVNEGDIVILSPVYQWFTGGDMTYGEKVFVALLFDVNRKNLRYIDFEQAMHLIPNTVSYAMSKLFPITLDVMQGDGHSYEAFYTRHSFNEYGDEEMHWSWENQPIALPADTVQVDSSVSKKAITLIADFKTFVEEQGASFYIIPPAFRYSNALNNRNLIKNIEHKLAQEGIAFQIATQKTNMADSLFFNTPYHLNRQGVTFYTEMILDNIFNFNRNE